MPKPPGPDTETAPARAPGRPRALRRWLTCVFPPALAGRRIELGDAPIVLGREVPELPLDDGEMSRRHAEVTVVRELDVFRVRDLESKNGTYVDGRRIDAEYLHAGSVLRTGGTIFAAGEAPARVAAEVATRLAADPALSPARAAAELIAELAAPASTPILIRGPSGSGKELLARRVHERSGRAGPLVPVNCATLSGELIASELFGHKRGAFSGAHEDRAGLFLAAAGGTLFLDEIADLPLAQQPALLRALQERRVRPVGADRELEVDVRVIAATHRDLETMTERGLFREDLIARLSGAVVELPGLARRREEILPLLSRFLGGCELTADAAEALLLHDWPRNVRELEQAAAAIELAHPRGEPIDLSSLPDAVQRAFAARAGTIEPAKSAPSKEALDALLARHGGNVAAVAAELGRRRQQIYRWMAAFGLDADRYRE